MDLCMRAAREKKTLLPRLASSPDASLPSELTADASLFSSINRAVTPTEYGEVPR